MKKLILLVFIIFMTNQDVQAERRQITEPARTINHQLRVHVTRHTTQQVEGHVHCVTHNMSGPTNVRQNSSSGGANGMQNPFCGSGTWYQGTTANTNFHFSLGRPGGSSQTNAYIDRTVLNGGNRIVNTVATIANLNLTTTGTQGVFTQQAEVNRTERISPRLNGYVTPTLRVQTGAVSTTWTATAAFHRAHSLYVYVGDSTSIVPYSGIDTRYLTGFTNSTLRLQTAATIPSGFTGRGWSSPTISSLGLGTSSFTHVGVTSYQLNIRDRDGDTLVHTRFLISRTRQSPQMNIFYGENAVDKSDSLLTSAVYSTDITDLPCGGEDGWTNQPLDIIVEPSAILGQYSVNLSGDQIASVRVNSAPAIYRDYHLNAETTNGATFRGFLTGEASWDSAISLSGTATTTAKIDKDAPVANAEFKGGFEFEDKSEDALSGLSVVKNPTKIAFTAPSNDLTPPTTGWQPIDIHNHETQGIYDVWIWATDKAGNEHITKVYADLSLGGKVEITKTTDQGPTIHTSTCINQLNVSVEDCGVVCSVGTNIELEQGTELIYTLTIHNEDVGNSASGSFTDYLPAGCVVQVMPVATLASGISNLEFREETTGPNAGRYVVTGDFALEPDEQIVIEILCILPKYDKDVEMNNLVSNQATLEWTINSMTGESASNYALHKVINTAGIMTEFQKVGADELSTGLAGAEFALYHWDAATRPSSAEVARLVDTTMVRDGEWQRVLENGETATDTATHFVSDSTGVVTLGNLEEGIYTLIETRAPSGYERPIGQWIMTINPENSDVGEGNYKIEFIGKSQSIMPPAAIRETDAGVHTYKIINARPFSIGMSGLEGTSGILLVGFVLMAVASNAYLVHGHKQRRVNAISEQM